jgi:hypothetical protein
MSRLRTWITVTCLLALAGPAAAASRRVAGAPPVDRAAVRAALKRMAATHRMRRPVIVRGALPVGKQHELCKKEEDQRWKEFEDCAAALSDPEKPAAGSPLDQFNKLTNAQLAQKCKGTLDSCLKKVLADQSTWCAKNGCKAQHDAYLAKAKECSALAKEKAEEKAKEKAKEKKEESEQRKKKLLEVPPLKKTAPPCESLREDLKKVVQSIAQKLSQGTKPNSHALDSLVHKKNLLLSYLKTYGCI